MSLTDESFKENLFERWNKRSSLAELTESLNRKAYLTKLIPFFIEKVIEIVDRHTLKSKEKRCKVDCTVPFLDTSEEDFTNEEYLFLARECQKYMAREGVKVTIDKDTPYMKIDWSAEN